MSVKRTLAASCLGVVLALTVADSLTAQYSGYFGRNKVQYEHFDFEVLNTEHFDIYYYPQMKDAAEMAARMSERWYARLSRLLNHEFRIRQPIILYANHAHFEQTNATPGQIDESTGGFTEILKRRIVLPLAATLAESDHVLGHEMVHAFQFDMTGQGPSAIGPDIPGAIRLPLWFIEGMAEYLSIGPVDPFTTMWMRDALEIDEFPTIPELNNPKYFPYRYGHAFWSYVAGSYGEDRIGRILKLAGRTANPIGSIEAVLEVPIDELSERWRQDVTEYFASIADETESPDAYGRRVIHEEGVGSQMNLGPSISPDGKYIAFVSEKDLFAIEMFLADAKTGEIIRKVTKTSVDPHFESLQYINSAGEWHPDGRRFLIAAVNKGQPIVSVIDILDGGIEKEIKVKELGEIFAPSWGPEVWEGEEGWVAFSASAGGFTDLFIGNLYTEEVRQLTNDPFADLQPAWSPDGRYIAFMTERYDAQVTTLDFGTYRLAIYDLETDEVRPLPGFVDGKNINPTWSPDGKSLYFISDHAGISNVYRIDMETEEIYLVTNVYTGVSGLTALSPAISMATQTNELAIGVNKGGPFSFEVYVIDDPEVLHGTPAPEFLTEVDPSVIPPRERVSLEIVDILDNSRLGLADPVTFDRNDYKPGLSLDYVSQPTLAFGASDFGVFFAGGAAVQFSDLLGNRTLTALLTVNTSRGDILKSTALLAGYENRSRRWNWGAVIGQIPFVTSSFAQGVGVEGGDTIGIFQEQRFFDIRRQITGTVAYPLNRASRLEFSAGFQNIDFELELRTIGFDPRSGQILFDRDESVTSPQDLYVGTAGAALVYDTSIFGGTSPILGTRYRIEVAPTFGSLNYVSGLLDFRKYFMFFKPVTFAGRAMHFGRYGSDSEDPRLSRLFVGWPTLVRGYDDGSFNLSECGLPEAVGQFNCNVFDNLLGSKIGVVNVEARMPLLGPLGLVRAPGVPPVEIGAFFDAGVAYTADATVDFNGCAGETADTCREWVRSVGFMGRLNLFGFAIAQLAFVNPLDREKDFFWQFSLTPGF